MKNLAICVLLHLLAVACVIIATFCRDNEIALAFLCGAAVANTIVGLVFFVRHLRDVIHGYNA